MVNVPNSEERIYVHRPVRGRCNFAVLPALDLLLGNDVVGGEAARAPTVEDLIENVSKRPPDTNTEIRA